MECAQKFLIIATCFHTSVVLSEEPAQDVQLTVSRAGVSRYRPGEWATIAVRGVNRSEDDRVANLKGGVARVDHHLLPCLILLHD